MFDENELLEQIKLNNSGKVYHRESQTLEFKESFNFAGLEEYFKDFAAFANNRGGMLVFGVTDSPNREPKGLSEKALEQFEKIDPEKISGFLNEIFSGHIIWYKMVVTQDNKDFAGFKIEKSPVRPIIAKKDAGKDQTIKNGEIYFRYGGRTQKIEYSELEALINERIKQNNSGWIDLMSKIGKVGPQNAAVYDIEKSVLSKDDSKILVVDEELSNKLKFIKEGEFEEKKGAPTLKLVGDVVPVDQVEVVKHVKENLLKEYPLTATELCNQVRQKANCKQGQVWDAIKENDVKKDTNYSAFNFRNKKQKDEYLETGQVPKGVPSIYKTGTVDYLATLIKNKKE
ncbi:MAG TPA: hypothetical protein DDY13_16020 [Cytophagales bacterium]|jgi:hypothetical protein|nr:hypothetical protein [Cytophagales bacterium]